MGSSRVQKRIVEDHRGPLRVPKGLPVEKPHRTDERPYRTVEGLHRAV
jgi:hypothetical protein